MKLSEAIRLGATLRPQAFGFLFSVEGGSCAQGAACEAIGLPAESPWLPSRVYHEEMLRRWPILKESSDCPLCHRDIWLKSPVGNIVMHLNNHHRWSRERIADYVEGIEAAEEAKKAVEVEAR